MKDTYKVVVIEGECRLGRGRQLGWERLMTPVVAGQVTTSSQGRDVPGKGGHLSKKLVTQVASLQDVAGQACQACRCSPALPACDFCLLLLLLQPLTAKGRYRCSWPPFPCAYIAILPRPALPA